MNGELKEKIISMAQPANPTQERMDQVIGDWDRYFLDYGIEESKQLEEFESIMRARLHSFCISILAPTQEEGRKKETINALIGKVKNL